MSGSSNGGRRSKGSRQLLGTRAALPLAEAAQARAREMGMTVSDYLAMLLAKDLGMTELAPAPTRPSTQQELHIPAA